MSSSVKIRPMGAERTMRSEERRDRHDEANSCFAIYYACTCVCVCVCARARGRARELECARACTHITMKVFDFVISRKTFNYAL
jgi:hypothetical protein